jgi:hypothetical protein
MTATKHLSTRNIEKGKGSGLRKRSFAILGPGLITGAADDDPLGISTYPVAGAAYGYAALWIALLTFPLMVAIQLMRAPRYVRGAGWQLPCELTIDAGYSGDPARFSSSPTSSTSVLISAAWRRRALSESPVLARSWLHMRYNKRTSTVP